MQWSSTGGTVWFRLHQTKGTYKYEWVSNSEVRYYATLHGSLEYVATPNSTTTGIPTFIGGYLPTNVDYLNGFAVTVNAGVPITNTFRYNDSSSGGSISSSINPTTSGYYQMTIIYRSAPSVGMYSNFGGDTISLVRPEGVKCYRCKYTWSYKLCVCDDCDIYSYDLMEGKEKLIKLRMLRTERIIEKVEKPERYIKLLEKFKRELTEVQNHRQKRLEWIKDQSHLNQKCPEEGVTPECDFQEET